MRVSSRLRRHAVRLRGLPRRWLLCAAAIACVAPVTASAQAAIWRGQSAGFDVAWTERDITASRAGRVVFSARRITDAEYARMQGDHDEEVPIREFERRYRLLSVVGSILSLEEATYCDCGGAHPISWTRFVSYDVARGTVARPHPIAATDVVPEAALRTALTSDHLIGAAMDSADIRTFTSVRELAQKLNTTPIEPAEGECAYSLGSEFPTEFALHHVEHGRVALRFSLGHYFEVCRGMMIQIGVLVPASPRWEAAVRAADARRSGYLMKDVARIAGSRGTVLRYRPSR